MGVAAKFKQMSSVMILITSLDKLYHGLAAS